MGGAPPQGTSGMHQSIHLIMSNKNIYGLGVGISTVFKIISHSLNGGGGAPPQGTSDMYQSIHLILSIKNIYTLWVVISKNKRILVFSITKSKFTYFSEIQSPITLERKI